MYFSSGDYERLGGSYSAIWPEGWNVTAAFALAEVDTGPGIGSSYEYDNYYLSFGRANQNNWSWSVNYGWSDFEWVRYSSEDKETEYYGVGVQHFIPKLNVECYASYQMFELEDDEFGGLD
jgi:hypothetical protein